MKKNTAGFLSLALPVLTLASILGLSSLVSAVEYNVIYDLVEDSHINWKDLGAFADRWLHTGCSASDWCGGADFSQSGEVDFDDFALWSKYWCLESETADPNLVAHWKLDETSGSTAYDSSDNHYDGTLLNGAAWEPAGGKSQGAVRFGGGDDRLAIPTTGISRFRGTITLWGRLEGPQTQHYRFFFGDRSVSGTVTNRVQIYMRDDPNLCVGLADEHDLRRNITKLINDNWYHIALTWGGGGGSAYAVYVDANELATGTHSAIGVLTTEADIGNSGEPGPVGGFHGLIDEVGIWDRVLDADEIRNVYNSGIPEQALEIASNPSPGNGVPGVDINADLSWTAGASAASHDVYFGTTSPGQFQGNQPGTTFDPGAMEYETTYYWRIDEVNGPNTWTGNIWSFTTEQEPLPPGLASGPIPAHTATGVSILADLSWTAGSDATSHDVYFGTDSSPDSGEFQGNQPGATFDPGTMEVDTTYYWRIDEKNASGTTTGNLWSFTTEAAPSPPGQASNPSPAHTATGVSILADLSWTAGSDATSHDVYFGTDSSPDSGEFQGNQPGATFDPGTMEVDTTYYWRIDEKNAYGTTTGNLWSFTTEAAPSPPGQASNPSPAHTATGVSILADLSWTAGSDATSHDVYFGTDSSPDSGEFQGNQPGTTYDPGTMEVSTTYYWRIDEKNAYGTTTGSIWSFTTGAAGPTPAFPTAEGAGKWTIGGRGGQVIEVTNLDDSGPGSLRAAIEASGPRIVVFNISGTITLESLLEVNEPYITIAGQTAPGDGICLRDYEFRVATDQVIVRYLRCRVGDEIDPGEGPEADPNCPDSLSVTDGHNIMIDHCSASWAVDETLSVSLSYLFPYSPTLGEVTVQWCMITEGLDYSVHVKGHHSCGSLIKSGWDNNYTFHHNLYAHHDKRLPSVGNYNNYQDDPNGWTLDFRNNVVYNWDDDYAGYYDADDNGVVKTNFIANYYIEGINSDNDYAFRERCPHSRDYFADNWMNGVLPGDPWSLVMFSGLDAGEIETIKQSSPFDVEPVATDSADVAYERVLADAGVTLPVRDSVDVRVINEVIDGTGSIIDDEDEVSGWPALYSLTAPDADDHDGMPDYWENQYGLDPNDDGDSTADLDGDGYTNIEEYLNNTDPNGNNDTVVYIGASVSRAYEEDATAGEFTVYRTGNTASALTVDYTVSGDATSGTDYTALSGSVTIPGGDASATITVTPINDPTADDGEQVIVSIDPNVDYKLGLPRKALVVIEDGD